MSDERLCLPDFAVDAVDECAPTEREPSLRTRAAALRGIALSVLWWSEGDGQADDPEPGHDEKASRAH